MSQNGKLILFSKRILIAAVIFSAAIIAAVALTSAASDLLALGKDGRTSAEITVNEINELAGALKDNDIIEYPLLFSAFVSLKQLTGTSVEIRNPSATVSSDMDYGNLLSSFTSPPPVRTLTISFPPGSTTDQIIDIFLKNGIGTREGFVEAINSYPFEYGFIALLDKKASGDRLYRLDGYLYPDTYDFYTGRAETYYIYKMLDRFCSVAAEIGMGESDLESVVIASMIEASSPRVSDYEYLSSAIHNRLRDPETYPYLCVPATSAYALGASVAYVGVPSEEIKSVDSPYNTFKNEGLPPGAICNPSKHALVAALSPADSPYKYFLTLESGEVVFAKTEREHQKNCDALTP